jgi:hypothetical protein
MPAGPATVGGRIAVPGAQDKGSKRAKERARDEDALRCRKSPPRRGPHEAHDEQERYAVQTTIGDLKTRLQRLVARKDDRDGDEGEARGA